MANKIKGITVEIGGETTKLEKALEGVNSKTRSLQSELRGVEKLLKMDPSNTELLAQKQTILAKAVDSTREKLAQLKSVQAQVQAQFDKGEITEEQYRDFQREIVATEQKLKSLTAEMERFGSVSAQKIAAAGTKVKEVGGKVEAVGRKFTVVSGVATGALVGITKGAMDFETAWTGVTKTVDGTDEQLEKIRQGLLDLSQETGSSAEEIAAVAEAAGQLGVKTENILSFTETMVRLGDSTNLSAEEASSAIAKLYNVMGSDINTVDSFGSALVALGNNSATTEADIMNMATRIAASGSQIGLTEQEILAFAATLSSVGMEAEAGGSAISTVMTNIDKAVATNDDTLNTWAKTAGMSASEFKKAWQTDAMSALQAVVKGMGDAKSGGENLNVLLDDLGVKNLRQTDTMKRLSNASDLLGESVKISNEAWKENTALTTESDKRYETTAAKLQQLKNTFTELCVTLGDVLLPVVQAVADRLKSFADWMTQLSPLAQKIVLVVLALVAALAPVLITIGKVLTAVGKIMEYAPQIMGFIGKIKTAITGLFGLIMAHPVIAIITAIIAAVVLLYTKCEWFRNGVNAIFESVKNGVMTAMGVVVNFFTVTVPAAIQKMVQFFTVTVPAAFNAFVTYAAGIPGRIGAFLSNMVARVAAWAVSMAAKARQAGSQFLQAVVSFFQQLPYRVGYFIGTVLGTVARWVVNMVAKARQVGSKFLQAVVSFFTQLPGRVWSFLTSTAAKAAAWAVNMAAKARQAGSQFLRAVVSFFTQLPGRVWGFLTSTAAKAAAWAVNMAAKARQAGSQFLQAVVSFFTQLPGRVWGFLSNVISKVASWGSQLVSKGRSAAKDLVSSIVNTVKDLPSKMLNVGKDLVRGLWDGITGMGSWIKDKVSSFASGLLDGFKDAFGVNSPSRETSWIGKMLDYGLAQGVERNAGEPISAMQRLSSNVLGAAEAKMAGPVLNPTAATSTASAAAAAPADNSAMLAKLDGIYERLGRLQVVMNGRALVGEIIDDMDAALGSKQLLTARGV